MPDPLATAIAAARAAGEIQRRDLAGPPAVREISQQDIKLETDVACEQAIGAILRAAFPTYALLAEEGGGAIAPDVPTWIVDPLDGTVNFAHRIPYFCTSIALQVDGRIVLGVVYNPLSDELFTALEGEGAYCNGARLAVSEIDDISLAVVTLGFSKAAEERRRGMEEMAQLAQRVSKVRIFGAAALDLAQVAAGRLDGFVEYGLRTWDIAAGTLLIREAGGRVAQMPVRDTVWNLRADNGRFAW